MEFFASAVDTLKVLVMAIGCGLGAWGIVNLLEGYGGVEKTAGCSVCKKAEEVKIEKNMKELKKAAAVSTFRSYIDDIISSLDDIQIVFNDDYGITSI